MVIAAKNPVHSVLFLILAFVNAPGLCLAECRAIGRDILLHRIVDVAERAHPVLHHRPNDKARKPIVGNIGSARNQERTDHRNLLTVLPVPSNVSNQSSKADGVCSTIDHQAAEFARKRRSEPALITGAPP
jgi:hypothetical protein